MDLLDGNQKDNIGAKVKMLTDCPLGRYKEGEIGTILPNDFDKYDYRVELSPVEAEWDTCRFKKGEMLARVYYFCDNEIEVLNPENQDDEEESFGPRR